MLRTLDIQAAGVTAPLLQASTLIAEDERPEERPVGFLRELCPKVGDGLK
jgi:hypothetical protein